MHHCRIDEQLVKHGLRKTQDRHKILKLFAENRTWTAAQIHKEVSGMDLSTVYRNINKLEGKGILHIAHVHDGETHYEIADTKHHDHLACEDCDVVECIPCPISAIKKHKLELLGLCANCKTV